VESGLFLKILWIKTYREGKKLVKILYWRDIIKVEKVIGKNIKELMSKDNVSIEELSEVINVSLPTMKSYLSGEKAIDSHNMSILAKYFNVAFDYLFALEHIEEEHITIDKAKELYLKDSISVNKISEVLNLDLIETRRLVKEWSNK
jgi:transcriptional regulator with XRE-family HTH domain